MYQLMSDQWQHDSDKQCPLCSEYSIETSYQEAIVKGKSAKTYTHCANPTCKAYHQTRIGWDDFVEYCKGL